MGKGKCVDAGDMGRGERQDKMCYTVTTKRARYIKYFRYLLGIKMGMFEV